MKALGRAWFQHPIAAQHIGKVRTLVRWFVSANFANDIGTTQKMGELRGA
jgi:hypothetical protein